jgi:hypothetical protein
MDMANRPTISLLLYLQHHHRTPHIVHSIAINNSLKEITMNTIIYIVGLVVVIGLVLSFFGLR